MSDFTRVGENLVRHKAGTIYLKAKVKGKKIRISLETSDLRLAKLKRDDRLATLRAAADAQDADSAKIRTIADAVNAVSVKILNQPQLRARTVSYYKGIFQVLRETLPLPYHAKTWTAKEAATWWTKIATKYAPTRANNILAMGKRVGEAIRESGIRNDDPTTDLKRMKVTESKHNVVSMEQIGLIMESVRGMKKANSQESADYIGFLAFAGCRHSQAKAAVWENIDASWIKFPSGEDGTKGAKTRELPISSRLQEILDRIEKRQGGRKGKLFLIGTPRDALNNATKRLGLPHLRIHDLRHSFTTHALERSVDVPLLADWLGHKDGGALLLRTYSHTRKAHSLASVDKL